jgi:hypothetical protein
MSKLMVNPNLKSLSYVFQSIFQHQHDKQGSQKHLKNWSQVVGPQTKCNSNVLHQKGHIFASTIYTYP